MKKVLIFSLVLLAALSCGRKDPNAQRSDIIDVFDSLDSLETGTPLERTWVSMLGGTKTYYIRTEADFEARWEDNGGNWATVSEPERIERKTSGKWTYRPNRCLPGLCWKGRASVRSVSAF